MTLTKGLKAANAIAIVLLVIVVIAIIYTILSWISDRKAKTISHEEMDIVIVGAGPAGCVLARRLHDAHPHLKILLMERGQDRHASPVVYNPAKALVAAYTAPYSVVIPVSDKVPESPSIIASSASMLGGGSQHNFGLVVHGSHSFYNRLGDHLGLEFNDFRKVFRRIEHIHSKFITEDQKHEGNKRERGTKGHMQIGQLPVTINKIDMIGPATKKAFEVYGALEGVRILERSLVVAGNTGPLRCPDNFSDVILHAVKRTRPSCKIVIDYNLGHEACVSKHPQLFIDFDLGLRCSVDVAYLDRQYLNRNNSLNSKGGYLEVGQEMLVQRLLFSRCHKNHDSKDGETRCKAVEWRTPTGHIKRVRLSKRGRVIVSAGGIYSPLILQQSLKDSENFVGAASERWNQIGQGLINHYGTTLIFKTKTNFNFSSGPIAFTSRLDKHSEDADVRDWQMVVGGPLLTSPDTLAKVGLKPTDGNFVSMLTWLMDPKARGTISGTIAKPNIFLNLYGDGSLKDKNSDIHSIVEALRWMYQVFLEMRQSRLFHCSTDLIEVVFPPEEVLIRDDLEELATWAKMGLSITDHYSGTCAAGSVVDAKDFKVKGLKNVHVVDASVFPIISTGNTEFPVLVLSEVASERIGNAI